MNTTTTTITTTTAATTTYNNDDHKLKKNIWSYTLDILQNFNFRMTLCYIFMRCLVWIIKLGNKIVLQYSLC